MHGDDFVIAGLEDDLKYVENVLRKNYPVKMRAPLGPDPIDHKEADILNRKVYWTEIGVEFEADAGHVGKMLKDMGMQECSTGNVPGTVREEGSEDDEELSREEVWRHRSVVERADYLAQDGPDVRFTVKELCRKMSKPNVTEGGL